MSAWQTLGGEGGCLLKLRPDNWDHSPTFPEQMEGGGTRGHCCRSWSSKGGGLFWREDSRRRSPFLSHAFLSQQGWWFGGTWALMGWGAGLGVSGARPDTG